MIDPGLPLQDQINQIISSSSASNSAQNLQPLQCQALANIYAQMFTSGSLASLNFLAGIPNIKNCIFNSFGQSELLGALAAHFGVAHMWN
jgi:hypothetical protein